MPDHVDIDYTGLDHLLKDRNGMVGRDMSARATRVQLAAKAQVGVKSGLLKQDITKNWITGRNGNLAIRVGSTRPYAKMHHDGTKPHVIRPKNAKALRYVDRSGKVVFAHSVQHPGTRANRYLTDNLPLAVQ